MVLSLGIGGLSGYLIGVGKAKGADVSTADREISSTVETHLEPSSDAPAYLVVLGEVFDRKAFMDGYASKLAPLYEEYGGVYLALGGGPGIDTLEGEYAPPSYVISRWPNAQAARRFWNSDGYDELRRARIDNGWGEFDVLLIQGLP